ncbi:phage major tail tube protein [Acinetobacter nosocomialis]|uniref:phage major tail tube protein n=1 Tax=Acinetobacter calcoaceticus/baumannii complex TaxID=909768 RepID=UPI000DCF7BD5|nr:MULTISPECIES: phage major tail tube protein [Acinetobacter calcoaceticus/baumannii complex]MDH2564805.1 phage major tail tube protein [Acinetobacter baumannii]QPF40557.1 phage major tail tube protein [Acinetobacter nosocomialis]
MALPPKLKNMNFFNEGNSYLGKIKTVVPPKLARKLEGYRGGGMNGTAFVDLGLSDDGLELELTLGGLDLITLRQFGMEKIDGVYMRFAGAYQRDDTGDYDSVEIIVRGRHEELDRGEATPGEDTEHKVKSKLVYYKEVINGVVEVEIDLLGFKENIGGVDRLEKQRNIIGIV